MLHLSRNYGRFHGTFATIYCFTYYSSSLSGSLGLVCKNNGPHIPDIIPFHDSSALMQRRPLFQRPSNPNIKVWVINPLQKFLGQQWCSWELSFKNLEISGNYSVDCLTPAHNSLIFTLSLNLSIFALSFHSLKSIYKQHAFHKRWLTPHYCFHLFTCHTPIKFLTDLRT